MNRLNACITLLLAAFITACGTGQPPSAQTRDAAAPTPKATFAEWVDGRLTIDVPVQIVSFGLSEDEAAALDAELGQYQVNHGYSDLNQVLRPDPTSEPLERGPAALLPLMGESAVNPMLPTAIYEVQAAPAALVEEFQTALASVKLSETRLDANAMEDWLAEALPRHGFAINPDAPTLVIAHLQAFGISGHGWKIQGPTGSVEPVRLFGERQPLLVMDPSAVPDPYAGTAQPYMNPTASGDAATIASYVRAATEFRLLQGPIYPVSQAPCHAITAIMGIRPTSLAQATPFLRSVEDALIEERIKQSFDNLTGTDTFFDFKIINLPVDDPVLDVLSRGEFPLFEVMRGYLSLNFDQYHVNHEGCERYLSVVFQSDAAAVPGGGIIGIGTYDDSPGHRISMSWVHEIFRLTFDPESPVGILSGDGKDYLNWWEYLFSHETGHILGQRHPHDISSGGGSVTSNDAFSSIWSSMSYQQDGRMIDFGAIDHNNWSRNRAGFALELAAADGRIGTPEWEAALAAARNLDWEGVWEALRRQ